MKKLIFLLLMCWSQFVLAEKKVIDIYIWDGVLADEVIKQFELETGISVNISTVDSNETLYTKLKLLRNPTYDFIMPTTDYLDKLRKQGMLERLDKNQLPNIKNLDPFFLNQAYDPKNEYSFPFIWGVTGIAVNRHYYSPQEVNRWSDWWNPKFYDRLLIINDTRELFSIALITLGYNVNDENPEHLRLAYEKLKALLPNIKIYVADIAKTIYVDEDAVIGMSFNGDIFKIQPDNPALDFVFPSEGFVIWTHTLAIPKNAPHLKEAYQFLNFLMRPDIAAITTAKMGYATANSGAMKFLPREISENKTLFPSKKTLARGQFETDLSDETLSRYEKYWLLLKLQN